MSDQHAETVGAKCRRQMKLGIKSGARRRKQIFFALMAAITVACGGAIFWNIGWGTALVFGGLVSSIGAAFYWLLPDMAKQDTPRNELSAPQIDDNGGPGMNKPPVPKLRRVLLSDTKSNESMGSSRSLLFGDVTYEVDVGNRASNLQDSGQHEQNPLTCLNRPT